MLSTTGITRKVAIIITVAVVLIAAKIALWWIDRSNKKKAM